MLISFVLSFSGLLFFLYSFLYSLRAPSGLQVSLRLFCGIQVTAIRESVFISFQLI
ncbi:hypothetical protein HMPREF9530_04314 [Escherichia coli MS 21-1]|nr:hypothetical protein HMPREF9530_04314 [Escherichia coli MS 21-1]